MQGFFVGLIIAIFVITTLLVACGTSETPPPAPTEPPAATPTSVPPTPTPEPPTPTLEPPTPTHTPIPNVKPQAAVLTGKIVFPIFNETDGTYSIYSARPDGSDYKLIVEEASQPGLKADGKTMVYRSWRADNRGLFEYDLLEERDIWQFNPHFEAGRPSYAPDGKSYLFHSREAGEESAIYKTNELEYDVLRREGNPIQGEAPAWTLTGDSFIYKTCIGTQCGLYVSNLDGSSPRQLTEDLSDTNPAVSADGETIAFMSEREGNWDVNTVKINGSNLLQLTTNTAEDGLPTWSPDGRTIAFVSDREDGWSMWAMNADGSNQRRLFKLDGSIDGRVQVDVANARGWLEESIAWGP